MLLRTPKHSNAAATVTASESNETGVGCAAPTSALPRWRKGDTRQNEKATHKTVNTQSFQA